MTDVQERKTIYGRYGEMWSTSVYDSQCCGCNETASEESIATYRSQLIHKGLIYATNHGEIDFTVPQFDEFLRRTHGYFSHESE